ncbi:hypothetical protein EV2_020037 [Malus domestica]
MERQKSRDLKDPLVHDNHGDIETPPLKNCEERSNDAPLAQPRLLHLRPRSQNAPANTPIPLTSQIPETKPTQMGFVVETEEKRIYGSYGEMGDQRLRILIRNESLNGVRLLR